MLVKVVRSDILMQGDLRKGDTFPAPILKLTLNFTTHGGFTFTTQGEAGPSTLFGQSRDGLLSTGLRSQSLPIHILKTGNLPLKKKLTWSQRCQEKPPSRVRLALPVVVSHDLVEWAVGFSFAGEV